MLIWKLRKISPILKVIAIFGFLELENISVILLLPEKIQMVIE